MTINLNARVKVTLSHKGISIWNQKAPYEKKDANNHIVEMQLWELFKIFGPSIQPGPNIVFYPNEIEVIE